MTNFFAQQERARRKTALLLLLVILAILCIIAVLYVFTSVTVTFINTHDLHPVPDGVYGENLKSLRLLPWVAGTTLLVIFLAMTCKIVDLSDDSTYIAQSLHGREISPGTLDPDERRLRNVVEEMAIAAGIRVPYVFLLDHEDGLNAFAAGNSPDDASVIVTNGLLHTLDRDELQAVIGHEFSHILNGDMRMNIKLIGTLAGIFCLAQAGLTILQLLASTSRVDTRRSNDSGNAALFLLVLLGTGVVLCAVGSIGYFFGRIIQSAVSRQREFLADASSAQFTRNPAALASALKCIGAAEEGSRLNVNSLEIAHLCLAPPRATLFATHPPLAARILSLDPSFRGDFGPPRVARYTDYDPDFPCDDEEDFLDDLGPEDFALCLDAMVAEDEASAPARTDPLLFTAIRHPVDAISFLLATTFSTTDPSYRPALLEIVLRSPLSTWADACGSLPEEHLDKWTRAIPACTPAQLRAGCELATDTLRSQPPVIREGIVQAVSEISDLDSCRTPFELALTALVNRRLRDDRQPYAGASVPAARLRHEAAVVLTVLCAYAGDATDRENAWGAAARAYPPLQGLQPTEDGLQSARALDDALSALRRLPNLSKEHFMEACHAAIEEDGVVTIEEGDLLRAIEDGIRA